VKFGAVRIGLRTRHRRKNEIAVFPFQRIWRHQSPRFSKDSRGRGSIAARRMGAHGSL
jgi:hypothetical protein